MVEGGSLENCSPEELGPWVRILLPPPKLQTIARHR